MILPQWKPIILLPKQPFLCYLYIELSGTTLLLCPGYTILEFFLTLSSHTFLKIKESFLMLF